MAATMPVEDLELLEELEDAMDVAAAKEALAESDERFSDERFSYTDLRRELGLVKVLEGEGVLSSG